MTYVIEHYQQTLVDNQITSKWCACRTFEDKELAEMELRNLNRAWVASGTFRLIKSTTPD